MPLILGTNSIKDTGYNVDNSLRFDDGSSDYLIRGLTATGNQKKWTWSAWVKTSFASNGDRFLWSTNNSDDGGGNFTSIQLEANKFRFYNYSGGAFENQITTSRVLRDPSAWYHLMVVYDSANSTADDRIKIYINGSQETSFAVRSNPSLNQNSYVENNYDMYIGSQTGTESYFNGYMTEVVFVNDATLDPTSFGEFDSDTNIWKPIDVSGLTFGTNGFYLDFESSGSLGSDVSGNSNNFTVNNLTSVDQSIDTCTNNFATMNPLANSNSNVVLSEGNLFVSTQTSWLSTNSTLGVSSGKWYTEIKLITLGSVRFGIGKVGTTATATNTISQTNNQASKSADGYEINHSDGNKYNNNSGASYGSAFSANDIGMIAFDADNGTIWFGKNGTWFNSATQSEIENGTTTNSAYSSITIDDFFLFTNSAETTGGGSVNGETSWNFGSPPFAISSGNADGNGYGNFEYAVPSGYYALNTKNLAEYG